MAQYVSLSATTGVTTIIIFRIAIAKAVRHDEVE